MATSQPLPCPKCLGDGRVANDEHQTPWVYWAQLPINSAGAVFAGLVRPVPCPRCKGSGRLRL